MRSKTPVEHVTSIKTNKIERMKEQPAALPAMALGLLFAWLGSESFNNPATVQNILGCTEPKRFQPESWHDQEVRELRKQVMNCLNQAGLRQFSESGRPGRARSKEYSNQERARADDALSMHPCRGGMKRAF